MILSKGVLFDSWFATPKGIMDIKNSLGMDVIAMVKKSGKVYYEYGDEQRDVKEIFFRCKKRRGRSKYFLSVDVNLLQKKRKDNWAYACKAYICPQQGKQKYSSNAEAFEEFKRFCDERVKAAGNDGMKGKEVMVENKSKKLR